MVCEEIVSNGRFVLASRPSTISLVLEVLISMPLWSAQVSMLPPDSPGGSMRHGQRAFRPDNKDRHTCLASSYYRCSIVFCW